ncbi:unnamed protein product [Penicillium roqueforti FM164]|uniref:Genomic scaffold, ProqFM164S03 n=1 Tax=Penicillium roqueforti (strain FM164) TaxID=1365484 RepID=W6QKW3_PENRF|nr:unnamed protein product [Penicillium roqueforti FM164]
MIIPFDELEPSNPLCAQLLRIPPLAIHAIPTQQPYSVQEVYVQPNHIVGAPLSLLFVAIYDRPPRPGEHDIPLNASGFLEITKMLF